MTRSAFRVPIATVGLVGALAAPPGALAQGQVSNNGRQRAATAIRAAEPIHVDGRLDEAAWGAAPSIGPLTQRDPLEGQPASEATEVKVLFTADALYFGMLCRDRAPDRIIATQLTRDGNLDVDDRVLVILDPFFDHRNGFFFEINPSGAMTTCIVQNRPKFADVRAFWQIADTSCNWNPPISTFTWSQSGPQSRQLVGMWSLLDHTTSGVSKNSVQLA